MPDRENWTTAMVLKWVLNRDGKAVLDMVDTYGAVGVLEDGTVSLLVPEDIEAVGIAYCTDPAFFPGARGEGHRVAIHKAHNRIRRRSGVLFVPHDLRRTAASYMTSLGINRLVVSKILNHAETGVTSVYDRHSYDREKRAALDAWARCVDEIISGRQSHANVITLAV